MPSSAEALQTAVRLLQAGQPAEAERICREILHSEPTHVPALHLLGVLALQAGHVPQAVELLTKATRIDGNQPSIHINLGEALRAAGQLDQAAASYRRALALDPRAAHPHFLLALIHQSQRAFAAAEAASRRAIELKPDFAEAHYALGHQLREQGQREAATKAFEDAVRHQPQYYEAWINLASLARQCGQIQRARTLLEHAVALRPQQADGIFLLANLEASQGNWSRALEHYRRSAQLDPGNALLQSRLGTALQALGHREEAIACYHRALALNPSLAECHYNLGTALAAAGEKAEAARHYELAVRHNPAHVSAHINLAAYWQGEGDDQAALSHYDTVLRLDPNAAETHYNRALILLANGQYEAAWPEYEWRMRLPQFPLHARSEPLWQGETLGARSLLVHAEQGLGDTLHFVRYLPLVRPLAGRVVLQAPAVLVPLLRQSGISDVYADNEPLPNCDAQVPLLSLPGRLGTTRQDIPACIPYLAIDLARAEPWSKRLANIDGFRIGIAWQGSPTHLSDKRRSVPLDRFAPLAQIPGVSLISLQKRDGLDQLAKAPFEVHPLPDRWDEEGAFLDTAAIMGCLDLVICADTAVAHLAGALGVPVWVALSTRPDWRWLRAGTTTPWYPTMRLFRQTEAGNWLPVMEQMAEEVRQLVNHR